MSFRCYTQSLGRIKRLLLKPLYDDFLNFPFYPDLGGTNAEYFLMHKRKDYHKFTVSERDLHPNDKGHKLIGEWFNEQVGRL